MWHFNIYNRIWTDFCCLQHYPCWRCPEELPEGGLGWYCWRQMELALVTVNSTQILQLLFSMGKTLQVCTANAVGYLIPLLDMMASVAQGHCWWTIMSEAVLQRFTGRNHHTHRSTGFGSYAGQRQEEQEKEEALTVMSHQCTKKSFNRATGLTS